MGAYGRYRFGARRGSKRWARRRVNALVGAKPRRRRRTRRSPRPGGFLGLLQRWFNPRPRRR